MKRAATSALVLAALFNPQADAKWVKDQLQRNVSTLAETQNSFTEMIGLDSVFAQGKEGEDVAEDEEKPKKKVKKLRCVEVEEDESDPSAFDDLIGATGDDETVEEEEEEEKDTDQDGDDDKDKKIAAEEAKKAKAEADKEGEESVKVAKQN